MIIKNPGAEFEYEGVKYVIGEPIIGTNESEYEGLLGSITEIRDGEDKDTENETPDLYCEFEPPVIPSEIKKLEEIFSDLYDEPKELSNRPWQGPEVFPPLRLFRKRAAPGNRRRPQKIRSRPIRSHCAV